MNFIGELAALATSFFFAMTALIFTQTGRIVGSQVTNRMRLTFALIYLVVINLILFREPRPFSAEGRAGFGWFFPGSSVCRSATRFCFSQWFRWDHASARTC